MGFLLSLAVVAVAGGGFATIAGLPALRDRCFGAALALVLVALALPIIAAAVRMVFAALSLGPFRDSIGLHAGGLAPFAVGHITLGVTLLRRRLRPSGRADDALELARGRGRERLDPGREVES